MRTAIYIEDGVVQLVLTPESDFERNAISSFNKPGIKADIFPGEFYDCRGGWARQRRTDTGINNQSNAHNSLILRVDQRRYPSEEPTQGETS